MGSRNYSFLDVAALHAVGPRLAAGEALVVLDLALSTVLWANGAGARLFGASDPLSFIGADPALRGPVRRQVQATSGFPHIGQNRNLVLRLAGGVFSRTTAFSAGEIVMPDGETALLFASVPARGGPETAIEGLSGDGQFAALLDGAGKIVAAADGFESVGIAPQTLEQRSADLRGEADRMVKRPLPTAAGMVPSGIVLLRDEPALALLVVVNEAEEPEEEDAPSPAADAPAQAQTGADLSDIAAAEPAGDNIAAQEVFPAPQEAEAVVPAALADAAAAALGDDGGQDDGQGEEEGGTSSAAASSTEDQPAMPAAMTQPAELAAMPVRFVWRTDAETRFTTISDEFRAAFGAGAADVIGRRFSDVAQVFGLDPDGEIAALLARRDTWSGRAVLWPVSGTDLRVPVDLAALPVYDRDRNFEGFRGFGVARMGDAVIDPEALGLALGGTTETAPAAEAADPFRGETPVLHVAQPPAQSAFDGEGEKVIRLAERRPTIARDLSTAEQNNFREIGARLRDSGAAEPADAMDEADAALTELFTEADGADDAEAASADTQFPLAADDAADRATEAVDAAETPGPAEAPAPAAASGPVDRDWPGSATASSADDLLTADSLADEGWPFAATDAQVSDMPAVDMLSSADEILGAADDAALPGQAGDADDPATPEAAPETTLEDAEALPPIAPSALDREPSPNRWAEAEPDARDDMTPDAPVADVLSPTDEIRDVSGEAVDMEAALPVAPISVEPTPDSPADDPAFLERAGRAGDADEAASSEAAPEEAEALDEPPLRMPAADAAHEPEADAVYGEAGAEPSAAQGEDAGGADAAAPLFAGAVAPAEGEARRAEPDDFPARREGDDAEPEGEALPEIRGVDTAVLSRLPLPILIHRGDELLFANRDFLHLTGYVSLEELDLAGGLGALFGDPYRQGEDRKLRLRTRDGAELPVDAHLQSVAWQRGKALLLSVRPLSEAAPASLPGEDRDARLEELRTIIDTATDGVVLIENDATIRSISRPAEALFGFDAEEVRGKPFSSLFAMESQRAARDYLASLADNGVASVLNDGREVIGRESQGGFIPLFMTIGRLPRQSGYCAVVRDITQFKRAEEELTQARAQAERASSQKTDFLARVSHEIRTPLNAIIGFSELMLDEKFGPITNDRYKDYLRDINRSGNHVLDLVNDLLDISKIEAGQLEMNYEAVSLNETLSDAVAMMQPQANRERVIIRSSYASRLPEVVADLRSIRQIALNLLSNAIRYTPAGGQVIVSTAYEATGDIVMRVRDTGIGMAAAEIEQALKPFKQINALKRPRGDGTGLGLPLTKAMVEANRARFAIQSTPGEGTLVEITFPSTRVLAH